MPRALPWFLLLQVATTVWYCAEEVAGAVPAPAPSDDLLSPECVEQGGTCSSTDDCCGAYCTSDFLADVADGEGTCEPICECTGDADSPKSGSGGSCTACNCADDGLSSVCVTNFGGADACRDQLHVMCVNVQGDDVTSCCSKVCADQGEGCSSEQQCCDGNVCSDEGTCEPECADQEEACSADDDCCEGTCGGSGTCEPNWSTVADVPCGGAAGGKLVLDPSSTKWFIHSNNGDASAEECFNNQCVPRYDYTIAAAWQSESSSGTLSGNICYCWNGNEGDAADVGVEFVPSGGDIDYDLWVNDGCDAADGDTTCPGQIASLACGDTGPTMDVETCLDLAESCAADLDGEKIQKHSDSSIFYYDSAACTTSTGGCLNIVIYPSDDIATTREITADDVMEAAGQVCGCCEAYQGGVWTYTYRKLQFDIDPC